MQEHIWLQLFFSIEGAEGELSICSGDYLLVWGPPDSNAAMLDAELLDGRRGLVPANFVQRLVGDDLLEFHQVNNYPRAGFYSASF